jgi:hypothetical protein
MRALTTLFAVLLSFGSASAISITVGDLPNFCITCPISSVKPRLGLDGISDGGNGKMVCTYKELKVGSTANDPTVVCVYYYTGELDSKSPADACEANAPAVPNCSDTFHF